MTPQELAQSGKPGLISARKTLLDRYNAASDPAEKQQISDAVDVVNDLITAADLDDLLMAAGPVDAAADAMANAIGTARMQIFGQALQTVVDTLAKFEVPKVKAPASVPLQSRPQQCRLLLRRPCSRLRQRRRLLRHLCSQRTRATPMVLFRRQNPIRTWGSYRSAMKPGEEARAPYLPAVATPVVSPTAAIK